MNGHATTLIRKKSNERAFQVARPTIPIQKPSSDMIIKMEPEAYFLTSDLKIRLWCKLFNAQSVTLTEAT